MQCCHYKISRKKMTCKIRGFSTLHRNTWFFNASRKYVVLPLSRRYSTPMETNLKIEKAEICESDNKYRNLIGALLYISSSTRPDISYSVNYLSRY